MKYEEKFVAGFIDVSDPYVFCLFSYKFEQLTERRHLNVCVWLTVSLLEYIPPVNIGTLADRVGQSAAERRFSIKPASHVGHIRLRTETVLVFSDRCHSTSNVKGGLTYT